MGSIMEVVKILQFILLLKVFAIVLVGNCNGLPSPQTDQAIDSKKTQILYMNNFTESWLHTQDQVVNLESTNYIRLVTRGIFVDKSLLLKVIFQDKSKCILIAHPRHWGKTTNLQMISHFAQMEFDMNHKPFIKDYKETRAYQMFVNGVFQVDTDTNPNNPTKKCFVGNKKLLISNEINEPVITEHLGSYVIIDLTFNFSIGDSYGFHYFLDEFKTKIISIYEKFSYVQSALGIADLNDFNGILNGTTEISVFQRSIIRLCRYLKKYFSVNRDNPKNLKIPKILILIDEYDFPFNGLFFSSSLVKDRDYKEYILGFIRFFMLFTFREGIDLFDKAIITGINQLAKVIGFNDVYSFEIYRMIGHNLYPFYDFTESEVSELLGLLGKDEELEIVRKWYGGYRTIEHLKEPTFNPISVIRYLEHSKPLQHWISTGSKLTTNFGKMLNHLQILLKFQNLFNSDGTVLIRIEHFSPSLEQFDKISLIAHGENLTTPLNEEAVDIAFVILFSCGYLGLSEMQPKEQSCTVSLTIPNLELRTFWEEAYDEYHFSIPPPPGDIWRKRVGNNLLEYLGNNDEKTFGLCRNSIQEMFKNSEFQTLTNDFVIPYFGFLNKNQSAAHLLMLEALRPLQRDGVISLESEVIFSCYSPIRNKVYKYGIYLFAFNSENVTIVEMKADPKLEMDDVLFEAELYLLFFDKSVFKFSYYNLLAVNFHHCEKVLVEHKVFNRKQVEDLIKTWKNYEGIAKKDYEKNDGFHWGDLNAAFAKEKIIDVAKKSRPRQMPQIMKYMPEELKHDPMAWTKDESSKFIKYFAKHYGMNPPDDNSILFTLNGELLCSLTANGLDYYFPTDGKLSNVLESLTTYFEGERKG